MLAYGILCSLGWPETYGNPLSLSRKFWGYRWQRPFLVYILVLRAIFRQNKAKQINSALSLDTKGELWNLEFTRPYKSCPCNPLYLAWPDLVVFSSTPEPACLGYNCSSPIYHNFHLQPWAGDLDALVSSPGTPRGWCWSGDKEYSRNHHQGGVKKEGEAELDIV